MVPNLNMNEASIQIAIDAINNTDYATKQVENNIRSIVKAVKGVPDITTALEKSFGKVDSFNIDKAMKKTLSDFKKFEITPTIKSASSIKDALEKSFGKTISFDDLVKKTTDSLNKFNPKKGVLNIPDSEKWGRGLKDASFYIDKLKTQRLGGIEMPLKKIPDFKTWGSGLKDADILIKEITPDLQKSLGGIPWDKTEKAAKEMTRGAKKAVMDLDREIKNSKRPFAGYAMSIMFFGMALQRTFNSTWASSQKTFNDIMHSVDGTVTSFDKLDGSISYLQMALGAAFEPVAEWLYPIIDILSEIIINNEEWVGWAIAIGGALGALLGAGGFLTLAANGFLDLATKIGLAKTNADGLVQMDWAAVGKKVTQGIGIIAIGWALTEAADAYKDFKEGKVISGMISALSASAAGIGGIMLATGKNVKAGAALVLLGVGLHLVEQGTFFQTVTVFVGRLMAIFETAGKAVGNLFSEGFNHFVIEGLKAMLKTAAALLDPFGLFDLQDKLDEGFKALEDAYNVTPFDWNATYNEALQKNIDAAKELDKIISSTIAIGDLQSQIGVSETEKVITDLQHISGVLSDTDSINFIMSQKDIELLNNFKTLIDQYNGALNIVSTSQLETLTAMIEQLRKLNETPIIENSDIKKAISSNLLGIDQMRQLLASPDSLEDKAYLQEQLNARLATGESSSEKKIIVQNLTVNGVTDLQSLIREIARLT